MVTKIEGKRKPFHPFSSFFFTVFRSFLARRMIFPSAAGGGATAPRLGRVQGVVCLIYYINLNFNN
jgi:hypothetical protein